jgi:hypothetical protein
MNASAFEILSKNIYADVPRAIIRELLCNGIDACVKAKTIDPVEISLPTSENPTIVIRDYGVGMSVKEVQNVYTTYFESTKRNTNSAIGMLGLGCKTPFAYCDQYTVTTSKNGKKAIFLIFRNSSGIPETSLISEEPTTDRGTEVEIPIQSKDFDAFYKATWQTIVFFKDLPTIIRGQETLNRSYYMSHNCAVETAWKTLNEEHQWINSRDIMNCKSGGRVGLLVAQTMNSISFSTFGVVMGGVYYSVEEGQLTSQERIEASILRYPEKNPSNFHKAIRVPIGEVDIQPSREMLNYSDKTKTALTALFQKTFNEDRNKFMTMTRANMNTRISQIMNCEYLCDILQSIYFSKDSPDLEMKERFVKKQQMVADPFIKMKLCSNFYRIVPEQKQTYFVSLGDSIKNARKIVPNLCSDLTSQLLNFVYTDKELTTIVKVPEKVTDELQLKSSINKNRVPAWIVKHFDLIPNHGKMLVASDDEMIKLLQQMRPDLSTVDYNDLKPPRKEKAATGPKVETINHRDDPDFIQIVSNKAGPFMSLSQVVAIATSRKQRIYYEVFSGSSDDDLKTCWNEYEKISALQQGMTKKGEVNIEVFSRKGFASIGRSINDFENSLSNITKTPIKFIDPNCIRVAVRFNTFIKLRLWEDPMFVQLLDDVISQIKVSIAGISIRLSSEGAKENHLFSKGDATEFLSQAATIDPNFKNSKFGEILEICASQPNGLDRYEANNLIAAVVGFKSFVKDLIQFDQFVEFEALDPVIENFKQRTGCAQYNTIISSYKKEQEEINLAYPLLKFVDISKLGPREDIVRYVKLMGV